MDSAEECKAENIEPLVVPKEECKDEGDIETLLVPKKECEVEDTETLVVPKEECKAGDTETVRVLKEEGKNEKTEKHGKDLVGRIVQKDFKDHGLFIGKVVSYHPAQGFYRVRYEDGDREDLELHELKDIWLEDGILAGELVGRKQRLEKLLQQESRKRSRNSQFLKPRQRQRPGKRERAKNGTDEGSVNDFIPWREVGECLGGGDNPCKVDDGQVETITEAEAEGNTEAEAEGNTEAGKDIENTEAEAERNALAEDNVKAETDGAVAASESKPQGRETDGAVKGSEFVCQIPEINDAVEGSKSKTEGAVKNTDFKCEGRKTDGAVEGFDCNPQGGEKDGAVDGSERNHQDIGTAIAAEGLGCMRQGRETDGAVEGSECKRQGRGKRKGIFDDRREPKPKRQRQCKSSLDGSAAVSSKLARKSQQWRHSKSGAERVAFSSKDNSCEQKSEFSETRESASKDLELRQPLRRRGRGKSRIGSGVSPQENEVGKEHPESSSSIKLPHQTAVSTDPQKERPQRIGDCKASVHIFSEERDSDVEKDNSSSEKSFCVGNENAYSRSDASDTEDSGQVLLSLKAIDFPLPPMKPLPQSTGDLPITESSVPDLFSVYSCLRRFSNLLFLSPFTLDDFVGALNFKSANTLLDSVHICLLKAVRRHLEMLSAEGNEKASKCFRQLNWNFLEAVTWPVYLVEYLLTQGFSSWSGQNISHLKLLGGEYYTMLPSTKLTILQFLCDNIMEAEEVRTEINMRVNFEQDADADMKMNLSSGAAGLIGRNPCYSKRKRVSCTKIDGQRSSNSSQVTLDGTHFHSDNSIQQNKHSYFKNGQTEFTSLVVNDVEDFNSDECCLCGMDGNLICCDGCPSAYHFRCVGISKAHLPEGAWYCPECVVEKSDTQGSKASKSLSGAEIFGIDPYGRVFFGTCGYLLVSDSASNPTTTYRYYNKRDVTKVMETLEFSVPFYGNIRNSILQYWGVPEGENDPACHQKTDMASGNSPVAVSCLSVSEHLVEQEDLSASGLLSVNSEQKVEKGYSVHDHERLHVTDKIHYKRENESLVMGPSNFQETEIRFSQEATGVGPDSSVGGNLRDCGNGLEQQFDLDPDRTAMQIEFESSSIPGNQQEKEDIGDRIDVQEDGSILNLLVVHKQTDGIDQAAVKIDLDTNSLVYKASFKPNTYINYYVLGDIAASAAANLASISVEDSKLVNRRRSFKKTLSATMSEQVKTFSKAAVQFCWPSYKKKSMEPPKERCGWCASCKSNPSSRRGCLLNLAACNLMAGAANVPGGLRPTKNGEGHLPAVAAYILYIEDCLRGLMVGPWENLDYRRHWRKCLEQASTAKEIRASLLELEKNIRLIALAAGWTKHADDWSPQVSAGHIGPSTAVTAAKRGGNGKRPLKNSAPIVLTAPEDAKAFRIFYWCKVGSLSSHVLQWCILPCAMAKRAGRQGGLRRIPGILYAEGCDIPRRSRQYTWRAAVERAKSVSQLAVQVRYLDVYIRWKDLVYQEDNCHDGKAVDKEGLSFRNSTLCGKRYEGGEAKYLLDFGNQKDIPICAVKHGRKFEEIEGSGNKYWLGEFQVPLYLLKAFEERLIQDCPNKGLKQVWKDQNRLMKGTRNTNIFAFLLSNGEMNEKSSCAQCGMDMLVRKGVKCNFCEGSFHQGCTVTSDWLDRSECNFTCYKCYNFKLTEKRGNILKATEKKSFQPLCVEKHVQNDCFSFTYKVEEHRRSSAQLFDATAAEQNYPGVNRFLVQRKKPIVPYYQSGLLWKKSLSDESGKDFRKNKLLLSCQNSMGDAEGPRCFLCRESYNPKLIYVGCEHCKEWFHGDALGLNQENAVKLCGFKCHRCRKKSGPECPHAGKNSSVKRKKLQIKRSQMNIHRDYSDNFNEADSNPLDVIHNKPGRASDELWTILDGAEQKHVAVKFEPVFEHASQVPPLSNHQSIAESETYQQSECSPLLGAEDLSPQVDWDFSVNDCLHDDQQIEFKEPSFEYMEPYSENEPLFSFKELLASEVDQVEDLADPSQAIIENLSDSLSNNKEIGIGCQPLGIEPQGFPYNEPAIPSSTAENMGFELPNDFLQENLMGFQLHGEANKVISEENQYHAAGNTVNFEEFQMHGTAIKAVSEELGKLCKTCGFTVLPSDYQCKVCGIAIHRHCYECKPLGIWTALWWTCDGCQGGLIQDKGF